MNTSSFETVIRPGNKSLWDNIAGIWKYRDLVRLFVRRNMKLLTKQSVLGPFWIVASPLITTFLYTFVFGRFAGLSTDGLPYVLFYFCGTMMWNLFQNSVTRCSATFTENSSMFSKVYFPRMSMAASSALTSLVNFVIQFGVMVIFFIIYYFQNIGLELRWSMLLLPVLVCQCTLLGTGVGLIVSATAIKYRDLANMSSYLLTLWMYASPVIYPLSSTGGFMRTVLILNPMTAILQNTRFILLGRGDFLGWEWALSGAVSIAALAAGMLLFNKTEATVIDSI